MEVIKELFTLLEENDRETMRVFWSWITGRGLQNEVVECA